MAEQRGDELGAVENAPALRDDDEKGVVRLQDEAEDFPPGEETGLELGIEGSDILAAHRLHLRQLFAQRARLPQFVVDPNAIDGLLEGRGFVHLPRDVSLADHCQEGYQLVEILVHHETSSLFALFPRPCSAAALGRVCRGAVIVWGAGRCG